MATTHDTVEANPMTSAPPAKWALFPLFAGLAVFISLFLGLISPWWLLLPILATPLLQFVFWRILPGENKSEKGWVAAPITLVVGLAAAAYAVFSQHVWLNGFFASVSSVLGVIGVILGLIVAVLGTIGVIWSSAWTRWWWVFVVCLVAFALTVVLTVQNDVAERQTPQRQTEQACADPAQAPLFPEECGTG